MSWLVNALKLFRRSGVTDSDWKLLALESLQGMNLETARKSFIRIRDLRFIDLIDQIERAKKLPNFKEALWLGDIMAYQSKFMEAAKFYNQASQSNFFLSFNSKAERAVSMFVDLRDWENAKKWAANSNGAVEFMVKEIPYNSNTENN